MVDDAHNMKQKMNALLDERAMVLNSREILRGIGFWELGHETSRSRKSPMQLPNGVRAIILGRTCFTAADQFHCAR